MENPFQRYKSYGITCWVIALVISALGIRIADSLSMIVPMLMMIASFLGIGGVLIYIAHYHGEGGYQRFKKMWLAAVMNGSQSYRERLEKEHPIHFRQLQKEMVLHHNSKRSS